MRQILRLRAVVTVSTLILAWFASSCNNKQTPDEETSSIVAVKLGRVSQRDLDVSVAAPAAIFPREQASIAARVTAPIRSLRVKKGDMVSAGQMLALLDSRDTEAQREDARAQLTDAEIGFQKTQSGTVPADLDRVRGQLDIAQSSLAQAQKNYDRRAQLFSEGVIPNRDLLQAQTDLAQAKTNADVTKRAFDLMKNQTGTRDIRSAEARVNSAKARLHLANAQLQFTELRAPFPGTITEQMMYPGDMANPGAPLFQIMDLSTVTARAQVPEREALDVRKGQTCSFTAADNPQLKATGRLTVVNRAVDPQRRTIETWCEINNTRLLLRGNVYGELSISTNHFTGVTAIPSTAIQFVEGTRNGTVLVVDKQMTAHIRSVEGGQVSDGSVPIFKGLSPGELVVIEGGYGLPDNTKVRSTDAPDSVPVSEQKADSGKQ